MDALDSVDESDGEPMYMDILEDIRDGRNSCPGVNGIYARYKIYYIIKQRHTEWIGVLLSTQNMSKGLQKVFKVFVNEILQVLPILGESGSEVSYFNSEPRNFADGINCQMTLNKPWIKATLKEIKNLIKNQNFLVQEPEKGEPVNPCMDVYKT